MAITLTGTGGLFTRIGRIGGALNSFHAFLGDGDLSSGGLTSLGKASDNIADQFESSLQDLDAGLYTQRNTVRAAQSGYFQYLRTLAQQVLIAQVDADTRLIQKTVPYALRELIRQMVANSASVTRPTVSVSVTAGGGNTGDGVCVASVIGPDGAQLDYIFNEPIRAAVTSDSQSGQATAGQEPLQYFGTAAISDPLQWDWPGGSGATGGLTAVAAGLNNSGGNLLTNSSFTDFSEDYPLNWVIAGGEAGADILQATDSDAYDGDSCLALVGDGEVAHELSQAFNTAPSTAAGSGGTLGRLRPGAVYAVNLWAKVDNGDATGTVTLSLVDGDGTVLNDAAGAANTVTITVDNLTTDWAPVSGYFRTPAVLPAGGVRLRIKATTAISNGHTLYLDHLALAEATRLYPGGPFAAVFSGATPFVRDDSFAIVVSNNYGSKWAKLLERFFGLRALGLAIPSSGSPTIADSLVA